MSKKKNKKKIPDLKFEISISDCSFPLPYMNPEFTNPYNFNYGFINLECNKNCIISHISIERLLEMSRLPLAISRAFAGGIQSRASARLTCTARLAHINSFQTVNISTRLHPYTTLRGNLHAHAFDAIGFSRTIKSYRRYYTTTSDARYRKPHGRIFYSGLTATLVCIMVISNTKNIMNDNKMDQNNLEWGTQNLNNINADDNNDGDTFEMELYNASNREYEQEIKAKREKEVSRKYVGILLRIRYLVQDYILEPLITLSRLCELTILFFPVILSYPIVFFGHRNRKGEHAGALRWYKFVRIAAETAGASFIKLGQWAASRTDIFSSGLCDELSKLHSNARSHSFAATKKLIKQEFNGMNVDDLFDEIYPIPIGTGAIAQVYLAKVSSRFVTDYIRPMHIGEQGEGAHDKFVAVKVEHPGARMSIERDLKIMKFFANFISCLPTMEWLSLPQEVDQFAMMMRLQLDMRIEAKNLERFRKNFKKSLDVKFPVPWFSSRRVLIEERVQGIGMSRVLELKRLNNKHMSKQVSDVIVDSFLKMLILDNFVHADLHAGNMIIRFVRMSSNGKKILSNEEETDRLMSELSQNKYEENATLEKKLEEMYEENYRPQVCFIDTGLITELNDRNRYNFLSLFNALSQFDGYRAGELMIERSKTPETAINTELFKYKVEKLVDQVRKRTFTLGSISIGDILEQMLSMVRLHHVRMEGDFVTVIVAILLLEGIGRQLDPDLDLFARCVFAWYFGVPTV